MKQPLMVGNEMLIDLADIRLIYLDPGSGGYVIWFKDNKEKRVPKSIIENLFSLLKVREIGELLKD